MEFDESEYRDYLIFCAEQGDKVAIKDLLNECQFRVASNQLDDKRLRHWLSGYLESQLANFRMGRGRRRNEGREAIYRRCLEVAALRQDGMKRADAIRAVAKKHYVSEGTMITDYKPHRAWAARRAEEDAQKREVIEKYGPPKR